MAGSSRITTKLPVEWDRFNTLQIAIYDFLRKHAASQTATRIELNWMILETLRLLHEMILLGFVPSGARTAEELEAAPVEVRPKAPKRQMSLTGWSADSYLPLVEEESVEDDSPPPLKPTECPTVRQFIPILLRVLDGTGDRFDEDRSSDAGDARRYTQMTSITHDTVVIMNCKIWACRTLQVVCTMRVDIRLSRLLYLYHQSITSGAIEQDALSTDATAHDSKKLAGIMQVLKIPQIKPAQHNRNCRRLSCVRDSLCTGFTKYCSIVLATRILRSRRHRWAYSFALLSSSRRC